MDTALVEVETLPHLVYNRFWGHKCVVEGCENPVLSNGLAVQSCVEHYIERCAQFGIADPVPYSYMRPTFTIDIYVDGACKGNPGPGGYGIVMVAHNAAGALIKERHVLRGIGLDATNNKAEISSAIAGLKLIRGTTIDDPVLVNVTSDSEYLVRGINEYIYQWMRNGWKTAAKNPVANRELWEELWDCCSNLSHRAQFKWTKGHAHSKYNLIADELAQSAARTQNYTDKVIQP